MSSLLSLESAEYVPVVVQRAGRRPERPPEVHPRQVVQVVVALHLSPEGAQAAQTGQADARRRGERRRPQPRRRRVLVVLHVVQLGDAHRPLGHADAAKGEGEKVMRTSVVFLIRGSWTEFVAAVEGRRILPTCLAAAPDLLRFFAPCLRSAASRFRRFSSICSRRADSSSSAAS